MKNTDVPHGSSANCLTPLLLQPITAGLLFIALTRQQNGALLFWKTDAKKGWWESSIKLNSCNGTWMVLWIVFVCVWGPENIWLDTVPKLCWRYNEKQAKQKEKKKKNSSDMMYPLSDWYVASSTQSVIYYLSHFVSHCSSLKEKEIPPLFLRKIHEEYGTKTHPSGLFTSSIKAIRLERNAGQGPIESLCWVPRFLVENWCCLYR